MSKLKTGKCGLEWDPAGKGGEGKKVYSSSGDNTHYYYTGKNLVVIDIDSKKIPKEMKAVLNGLKPTTKTAKGAHWYFTGKKLKYHNRTKLGSKKNVDVRGENGKIFYKYTGNSKHINYKHYEDRIYKLKDYPMVEAWLDGVALDDSKKRKTKDHKRSDVGLVDLKEGKKLLFSLNIKKYRGRDEWIKILAAFYHGVGAKGEKTARKWSKQDKKVYDARSFDQIWSQLVSGRYGNDISYGTLRREAGDVGGKNRREELIAAFPIEKDVIDYFPKVIRDYALVSAQNMGVPATTMLPGILSTMGATVGDSPILHIKKTWGQTVKTWGMLIGYSGSRKSSILKQSMLGYDAIRKVDPLTFKADMDKWNTEAHHLEMELKAHEKKLQTLFNEDKGDTTVAAERRAAISRVREKILEHEGDKPKPPLGKFEDVTDAALAEQIAKYPEGILGYYPEGGTLEALMKSNAGHTETLRQIFLKGYDGEGHIVHRKTADDIVLDKINISMLGAIQPEVFASLSNSGMSDGLMGRFQFCVPINPDEVELSYGDTDEVDSTETDAAFVKMYKKLQKIRHKGKVKYTATEAARVVAVEFEKEMKKKFNGRGEYWGKLNNSLGSLALLFHIVENPKDTSIDAETMERAANVVRWFIKQHSIIIKMGVDVGHAKPGKKVKHLDVIIKEFGTDDVTDIHWKDVKHLGEWKNSAAWRNWKKRRLE